MIEAVGYARPRPVRHPPVRPKHAPRARASVNTTAYVCSRPAGGMRQADGNGRRRNRSPVAALLVTLWLLAGCASPTAPPSPAPPGPPAVLPLDEALRAMPNAPRNVTVAGYLFIDSRGPRLVAGVSFSEGATPAPLPPESEQVWVNPEEIGNMAGSLREMGGASLALVIASGRLAGPGSYGFGGLYRFRLEDQQLQVVAPLEATVAGLIDSPATYAGRLVRVNGAILVQQHGALLVERLSAGGVPEPGARQVKLRLPHRDPALLGKLQTLPGREIRFGRVQIEGFWSGRTLTALALFPITKI